MKPIYKKIFDREIYTDFLNTTKKIINDIEQNDGYIFKIDPRLVINNIVNEEIKLNNNKLVDLSKKVLRNEFKIFNEINPILNIKYSNKINIDNLNNKESIDIKENDVIKQKIINSLIQGAAYNVNNIFHIIDELPDNLKHQYKLFNKINEYCLYSPNQPKTKTNLNNCVIGKSHVDFLNKIPRFNVEGTNFLMFIHESIKSLYTYLSFNAYSNEEYYKKVVNITDKFEDEIDDILFGNFLYNKVKEYLINNYDKYYNIELCFFELFFVNLCKLESENFIEIVNNILLNKKNRDIENLCHDSLMNIKKFEANKFID